MKRNIIALICLLASVTIAVAKTDVSGWLSAAPITVKGSPVKGVVEFSLSPEVFDLAKEDLSDLRVITAQGDEAGYIVRPSGVNFGEARSSGRPHKRAYLRAPVSNESREEKDNTTTITLDLGFRNLPLGKITVSPSAKNFYRPVIVYGRNAATHEITVPMEDSPERKKTEEEPWKEITRGGMYRYPRLKSRGESLTFNLDGAKYRYLKLVIANGNNAPLKLTTSVTRRVYSLDFQPQPGAEYRLYVGNETAKAPIYDLPRFIDSLRSEGVTTATLGKFAANPAFIKPVTTIPFSERYRVILWIAILAVFAILLLLIIRQLKAVKSSAEEE